MRCAACGADVGNDCLRLRIGRSVLKLCSRHCLQAWLAAHPDKDEEWGPE